MIDSWKRKIIYENFDCIYNQWQNIMGILILCLKIRLSPYTMLRTHNIAWRKFCSFFLNIVKRGKGVETRNCPTSSFSHNFCHWLSEKNLKKLSIVFYSWFFWITLKASNYPLRHYDISLDNFWSPNKQLKYLDRWGKVTENLFSSVKDNNYVMKFWDDSKCKWDQGRVLLEKIEFWIWIK